MRFPEARSRWSSPSLLSMMIGSLMIGSVGGDHDQDSVSSTKNCFDVGEDIVVTFRNRNARDDDWLAVVASDQNTDRIMDDDIFDWAWTCGSKACFRESSSGTVRFDDDDNNIGTIPPGRYRVALAVDGSNDEPWDSTAVTSAFSVSTSCFSTQGGGGSAFIHTTETSYESGERIVVEFGGHDDDPDEDDWIAIYREGLDPSSTRQDGAMWQWICGGQSLDACSSSKKSGTVVFAAGIVQGWEQFWPLPPGSYTAFLLRNSDSSPYSIVAEGGTFEVRNRSGPSEEVVARRFLDAARRDIEELIEDDITMGPKFVRLVFHDCVGGCDGCIDLAHFDNGGLELPIAALRRIVERHASPGNDESPLSRADIWALAAMTASEVMQNRDRTRIDFEMPFYGRIDCDFFPSCEDDRGEAVDCRETRGPHRDIPHMHTNTEDLYDFFRREFGFDVEQTMAIMGAHTIGRLATENTGVDGPSGWLLNPDELDNEYYAELIGGDDPDDRMEELVEGAPAWGRFLEDNEDNEFPDRPIWVGRPDGVKIVMLNVDIALVRDLNEDTMDSDGFVRCSFVGSDRCPPIRRAIEFGANYKHNNLVWLEDFEEVMTIMLLNGYTADHCPDSGTCRIFLE